MPVIERCFECGSWPSLVKERRDDGVKVYFICTNPKCGRPAVEEAATAWNLQQQSLIFENTRAKKPQPPAQDLGKP